MKRRKFTKSLVLGTATAAATGIGILFPKPAEAHQYDFVINDADIQTLFRDLIRAIAALIVEQEVAYYIDQAIQSVNQQLATNGYNQHPTPYAQRIASTNAAPIWGRAASDTVGPNPGMATAQLVNDRLSSAIFTGPTLVGINKSAEYLVSQGLSPEEIDGSLIPTRSRFEDWTTWLGDQDDAIGPNPGVGLTQYETKLGQVIRRYDAIDPYGSNIGRVRMTIEAANQPRRLVTTNILAA